MSVLAGQLGPLGSTRRRAVAGDPVPDFIHRWTFDADDGTDEVGTASATGAGGLTYEDGVLGRAAVFNGSTAVLTTDAVPPMPSVFTASCWMRGTGTGVNHTFMSTRGNIANGTLGGFIFQSDASGKLRGVCYTGAGLYCFVYGNTVVRNGAWRHVVLTYDGTNAAGVNLYLDGALNVLTRAQQSGYGGNLNPSGVIWTIGNWPGVGSSYMNGSIDDLRVYDRVLDTTEIEALYGMGSV